MSGREEGQKGSTRQSRWKWILAAVVAVPTVVATLAQFSEHIQGLWGTVAGLSASFGKSTPIRVSIREAKIAEVKAAGLGGGNRPDGSFQIHVQAIVDKSGTNSLSGCSGVLKANEKEYADHKDATTNEQNLFSLHSGDDQIITKFMFFVPVGDYLEKIFLRVVCPGIVTDEFPVQKPAS